MDDFNIQRFGGASAGSGLETVKNSTESRDITARYVMMQAMFVEMFDHHIEKQIEKMEERIERGKALTRLGNIVRDILAQFKGDAKPESHVSKEEWQKHYPDLVEAAAAAGITLSFSKGQDNTVAIEGMNKEIDKRVAAIDSKTAEKTTLEARIKALEAKGEFKKDGKFDDKKLSKEEKAELKAARGSVSKIEKELPGMEKELASKRDILAGLIDKHNPTGTNIGGSKSELDALRVKIDAAADENSNTSQMENMKIQQLYQRRNNAFEAMTNLTKKDGDTKSLIISKW